MNSARIFGDDILRGLLLLYRGGLAPTHAERGDVSLHAPLDVIDDVGTGEIPARAHVAARAAIVTSDDVGDLGHENAQRRFWLGRVERVLKPEPDFGKLLLALLGQDEVVLDLALADPEAQEEPDGERRPGQDGDDRPGRL